MNPDERIDALLRAARESAPDTERAEFAFETRVLARLREERNGAWFAIALRLSPIFAALVVAAAAWSHDWAGVEPDATYAWDALRSGGTSALTAWLPEGDQ